MGRVAKYKKVKSFDPYSKKNGGNVDLSKVGIWGLGDSGRKAKKRSRRAEVLRRNKKRKTNDQNDGFDLPPSDRDDFDLKDLVGSIKKQKVETLRTAPSSISETRIAVGENVATIPKTDDDEKAVARVLRVEKQNKEIEKKQRLKAQARIEGESKRAYARRTKSETRQIVKQSTVERNPEKMKKKKEFLNKKKNKNKFKQQQQQDFVGTEEEMEKDRQLDLLPEPEDVHFTEQAERPPMFKQLPRGAKAKETKQKKVAKPGMTEAQVKAESNAMELIRRRVQAQYASIKAKRKRAGDFHL